MRHHPCRADRWQAVDRLEGEEVSCPAAAIRAVAADDGDDRRVAMEDRIGDGPPFVADAYDVASLGRGRWHSAASSAGAVPLRKPPVYARRGPRVAETAIRQRPAWRQDLRTRSVRLQPDLWFQPRDGRSQVGFGGVPELDDQRMPLERLLHDAALNALAAAVNQPDLAQAGLVRGVDVFLDHRRDVARRERVEVEMIFDRECGGVTRATALLSFGAG